MADINKIKIGNDELDVTKKQDKIDSIHKLSADLVDDSSSTHKFTTAADISKLSGIEAGAEANVQSDWSQTTTTADDYIKNKPTIGNATLTIQKNSATIDTFTANATSNKTINITVPTTAADVSALPASTKYGASISVSINSTDYKITTTLKDQDGNTLGTAQVIDLPLESVVVSGSFDSTNKKIILTLQNGNTIDIPVGDLVAGLQTEITSENKLDSDLVDDTNQAHKFMTAAERTKLSGIATGAEVNVQSDWNVIDNTSDAFIKNKPTIDSALSSSSTNAVQNKIVKGAIDKKVDVANIDLTGQTTTLLSLTKALGTNSIHYARWFSKTDGGSSGISDKPTGSTNASFVCEAKCSRHNTTSDYTYQLTCWVQADSNPYVAVVKHDSTSISWSRLKPTVNNATLTIQKNGTTVQTFTANQSTAATANITVPTKTSEITNDSDFVTSTGTVAKADKLSSAKTIAIGTGGTGTATAFDGSSNITIPLTEVKDSYITWGDKDIYNNITPDDAGCIDEFGHNKLAFLPAKCIQVHYSTDGGTTWVDYGLTDAQKVQLMTYGDVNINSGKDTAATSNNVTNLKLRVRIACGGTTQTGAATIYTQWKKILINVNDPSSDATMKFRYRTIANYKAGTETWVEDSTTHNVRGGSGWNSIRIPSTWPDRFGGNMTNQTSQIGQIEFVFSNTKLGTWGSKKVSVSAFRMIGTTNWNNPSEMARSGRIYTMDTSQNVTFPGKVDSSSDITAYNIYYKGGTTYGHIGSSNTPFKDIYLSDGIYKGSYKLTLPDKAGTVALTSDIPGVFTGAGASTAGTSGLVPAPAAGDNTKFLRGDGTWQDAGGGGSYTAGSHINISNNNVISAVDYVHSENPVAASQAATISGSQITNGSIDSTKLAQGSVLTLQTTTTDPGEGAALPANTLLGVYNLPHEYKPGETLVVAQNMQELNWAGTTKTQWSGGSWTQYGPFATTTEPSWLQITTPENEEWVVKLHHITGTAKPNSSSWSHSGLLQASAPATAPYTYLTTSLTANGDLYLHQETNYIVTIPANTSTTFAVWVRTNSTASCIWYGGNPTTDSSSSSFNFGPSCIIEATLIEKRIV